MFAPNQALTSGMMRRIMNASRMVPCLGIGVGVHALIALSPVQAQRVPTERFEVADAVSTHGFTQVSGVRELEDGRLIVVDRLDRLIHLLGADLAHLREIGRQGQGPREYLAPDAVHALDGDRTAVYDGPQGRFLIIGRDASSAEVFTPQRTGSVGPARFMDRSGRLFALGLPVARDDAGRATHMADSAAVQRWDPTTGLWDTLAFVPVAIDPGQELVLGVPRSVAARDRVVFRPVPVWTISQDGTLAIVRPHPYGVELVQPDGVRRRGEPVRFEPIPVSEQHKEAWRDAVQTPRVATLVPLGERRRAGERSRVEVTTFPYQEPREWAETLPPFLGGAARFAPDGTLWVERTTEVGRESTFDVFDRGGQLRRRVLLPPASRLVGFGNRALFVVVKDEFDLEYIQRFRMEGPPE